MARAAHLLRPAIWILPLALVVWWATSQQQPHIPTDRGGLAALALALAVYALATVGRGERWFHLLRRRNIEVGRGDATGLTTVGYMGNNVLPARAGDILRVYLLNGRTRMDLPEGLGTAFAERLLDALALGGLFGVATLSLLGGGRSLHTHTVLVVVAVVAAIAVVLAGVVLLLLHPRRGWKRARALIVPFLASSRDLIGRFGILLLALSVLIWLLEASVYMLAGTALGLPMSFAQATYVMAFANLAGLLPAGPGYVGTYDAAVLLSARALGAVAGQGVSYLLLVRFVLFVPITAVGALLLVTRYGGFSRLPGRRRVPASQ